VDSETRIASSNPAIAVNAHSFKFRRDSAAITHFPNDSNVARHGPDSRLVSVEETIIKTHIVLLYSFWWAAGRNSRAIFTNPRARKRLND
jgi:hypothetical protein